MTNNRRIINHGKPHNQTIKEYAPESTTDQMKMHDFYGQYVSAEVCGCLGQGTITVAKPVFSRKSTEALGD